MEIERRVREFGGHYPDLVDDRGVLFGRGTVSHLYALLILLSLKGTPVRANRDFPRSDPLFDAVAREAFRSERGPHAKAWSSPGPPRWATNKFDHAVGWAAGMMGIATRSGGKVPTHLQDAGVDVIVWRPFPDGRKGFQIMLVQNTVQGSFRKKPHDVRVMRWFTWWEVGAPPGVGFAVPFAMPNGDIWWEDVTDGTDLVMDRGRLLHALEDDDPTLWPEWTQLVSFVDDEVAAVRTTGSYVSPQVSIPRPRRKTEAERNET